MKRHLRLLAILGLGLVLALSLGSCSQLLALIGGDKGTTTQSTLAEQVVDELVASLLTSGRALESSPITYAAGRVLSSTDIAQIKNQALLSVQILGLNSSSKLDLIVPAVLDGVTTAVTNLQAVSTSKDFSGVLVVAAKSVVISMGDPTRVANFSVGVTIDKAVSASTEKALTSVGALISDPIIRSAIKNEVMTESVNAIDLAPSVRVKASETIKSLVDMVAKTESSDGATFASMISSVTKSAVALTSVTDKAVIQNAIASEATTRITLLAATDTSIVASDFYIKIASSVTEGAGTQATETVKIQLLASIITAASDSGGDTSSVESSISVVMSEQVPVAAAGARLVGDTAAGLKSLSFGAVTGDFGKSVELVSSGSTSTGVDLSWDCILGDGPAPAYDSVNLRWTVTPKKNGTFVYKLTIKNTGGYKEASDFVTITTTFPTSALSASFDLGLQYLVAKDFTSARDVFAVVAAGTDANKDQAKAWETFLDLAHVSVNADLVSLFKDNFGFVGYPSDMNALFSGAWANQQWYDSKRGFVKYGTVSQAMAAQQDFWVRADVDTTVSYGDGIQLVNWSNFNLGPWNNQIGGEGYNKLVGWNPLYGTSAVHFWYDRTGQTYRMSGNPDTVAGGASFPLGTVAAYIEESNLTDLTKPWGMLPEIAAPTWAASLTKYFPKSAPSYPFFVMANLIDRNPAGLNAILDKVRTGAFGADLDAVIAALDALPDTVSIIVPYDLIAAFAPPTATLGTLPTITIDKPMLLALKAQLELMKGLVQYVSSYDFNVPLTGLKFDLFAPPIAGTDLNGNQVPDAIEPAMKTGGSLAGGITGTSFLDERDAGLRATSKATIIAGYTDLITAATAIQAKFTAGSYTDYFPEYVDDKGTATQADDVAVTSAEQQTQISTIIGQGITVAQGGLDALDGTSTGYDIPVSDPAVSGATLTITAHPAVLFDSAFFKLENLLESPSAGKVNIYAVKGTKSEVTEPSGWVRGEFTPTEAVLFDKATYPDAASLVDFGGMSFRINMTALESLATGVTAVLPPDNKLLLGGVATSGFMPVYRIYSNTSSNSTSTYDQTSGIWVYTYTYTVTWNPIDYQPFRMAAWAFGWGFTP